MKKYLIMLAKQKCEKMSRWLPYWGFFGVIFICGFMGCRDESEKLGPNVIFNPGFDMTPWDTGWTKDTATFVDDTTYRDSGYAIVELKSDSGFSLPHCCELWASATAGTYPQPGPEETWVNGIIYQTFPKVNGAVFKAYVKYDFSPGTRSAGVQLYINNQWDTVWVANTSSEASDNYNWTEISATINGTVSGIKIYAHAYSHATSSYIVSCAYLWIDDIYIGKAGDE